MRKKYLYFGGRSGDPNNYHGNGDSMLRVWSTNGQTVALQRLLEAGCNPNGKLGSGLSAYQNLVHRADAPTPLMDAVKNGNIEACDILCRYGAALDICVGEGTALAVAAEYNRTGCCAVLLAAGANPAQSGKNGMLPAAIAAERGHMHIARMCSYPVVV